MWPADPLGRRVVLARVSVGIERLLPRLWPAVAFFGFYLALALAGAFAFIPWAVQALLLAATITGSGLTLHDGLRDFSWPRSLDAQRRLERDAGLQHRPISEAQDRLAGGDAFAQALWAQHQARGLPTNLKSTIPHVDLASRDPHGLRWYLLVALALGIVLARSDTASRLVSAFDSGAGAAAGIDAWVDPPPYTGLPLISLHGSDGGVVTVPQGSVLSLRVHGAPRTPGLVAGSNETPRFAGEDGEYSANVILARDARVRVQVGGHAIGKWTIQAVADAAPTVTMTAKPGVTEQKAVRFAFDARDDYGVANVHAVMVPHGRGGKPLVADLALPQDSMKQVVQTSYVDLTSHPYAGLLVDLHLEARDAIGQVGATRTITFRLPARIFTDPLARALVEQRQQLATTDAAGRKIVMLTLDALAIDPDRFYDGKHDIFLALRSAFNGVKNARSDADIARVEELLWQTALKLERGGLLSAAEELRKLQIMLTAAMASGAPQEVIDELLKRYNEAMQRYVQALQANPGAADQTPLPPDAKTIGMADVQQLMKMIQQLSAAGDREQAAQLLAALQAMLENMHMTQGGAGDGQDQSPQAKARNQAIQKFGDLMGKQRALLDKTFRQQQGQSDPKDGGPQGLSKQQGDLQKELQDAMKGMSPGAAGKLRDAGKAMSDAQNALSQKDMANAGTAQNQALDAMRQGAEALAREAQQGPGGRQADGRDPLGRGQSALGNSGVKIPGPDDLARARAILEELRRRAGQMNRSQQERDYIDRLLKSF